MSDTLKCDCPITKPAKAKEAITDIQILEEKDGFWIKRICKYFLLFMFILFCFSCLVIFIYKLIRNPELQMSVVNKIIDNIIVLIISALSIFGINVSKNS